jgi:uncharacterized protein (DUF983 family)
MRMATPPPVWKVALLGRCPRCGEGALFRGPLDIRDSCEACGLDLRAHDAGDGPAVAGIFVIGALTVGLAIWVDVRFAPPLWVHAVLWPALVLPLSVVTMRAAKGALAALQWRHRRGAP